MASAIGAGLNNLIASVRNAWTGTGSQADVPPWAAKTWKGNRSDYSDAISLWSGDQETILLKDLNDTFHENNAKLLSRQPLVFPIVERIVGKRAMLYKAWPQFDGDAKLVELMDESLGGQFKQADRLSELCGISWVGPEWDAESGKVEVCVISADMAEPIWSPIRPGELEALRIYTTTTNSNSQSVVMITEWRADSFGVTIDGKDRTAEVAQALEMGPGFVNGENPYGCIPFVPMRPRAPLLGDNQGVPLYSLLRLQRTLNMKLTELSALIRTQAFSQLVVIGNTPPSDYVMGMGSVLWQREEIAGQGDIKYLTPSAAIADLWNVIKELVQYAAFLHCLSGQWSASGQAPSGEALKVNNADLEEYRRDKQDSHQAFIHEFGEVLSAVLAASGGPKTSGDLSVKEWGAIQVYEDPVIKAQEWEALIKGMVQSRTAWVMEEHPEMDEAQAKAFIEKVNAEEKQFRSQTSVPDASQFMSASLKKPMPNGPQDMTGTPKNMPEDMTNDKGKPNA